VRYGRGSQSVGQGFASAGSLRREASKKSSRLGPVAKGLRTEGVSCLKRIFGKGSANGKRISDERDLRCPQSGEKGSSAGSMVLSLGILRNGKIIRVSRKKKSQSEGGQKGERRRVNMK